MDAGWRARRAEDGARPAESRRYASEGVSTVHGDPIIEETNLGHVIKQSLGFTPADVSERYEQNSRMKNRETRIENKRTKLQRKLAEALINRETVPQSVWDEVFEFNRTYPEWPITPDTVRKSARSRLQARARSEFGIQINPKINRRVRDEEAPLIYG